ncbi:ABC transporter ATP-binding protein [Angustibacter luteus]|uniref:ABC transporter ATP-binding protein n=1 Tax=Angustibacter luteus TaxID=658456 RepID=A0ABW1JHJ8_9ACTN
MTDNAAVAKAASSDVAPERLQVEGLTVRYGGVVAVDGVSFILEPGQCLGIIGANGAGKTSTLRALMGLAPRACASMKLGEVDLMQVNARDVVRHGIGYVPEGRHVFGGLTVRDNLDLGAYSRKRNARRKATFDEVYELFPVLSDMSNRLAGTLSGGQQQMLAIGRAMMSEPSILVLDEPSMGLSPKLVGEVLASLNRLRERGLSLLLVEQNAWLTFEATERCLVLENGSVALEGPSADLRHDAGVRQLYLGL